VSFAPTTTGAFSGNVSLASTAINSPLSIPLSGTSVAAHKAILSWTPSTSSVSGYHVYRGTQKGGPYTQITSSLVPGSTYSDLTVQSGLTMSLPLYNRPARKACTPQRFRQRYRKALVSVNRARQPRARVYCHFVGCFASRGSSCSSAVDSKASLPLFFQAYA
jgi:hypothetical protein